MSSKQEVLDRFDERANEKLRNFQQVGLDKIDDICKDLKDEARDKLRDAADRLKDDILQLRERAVEKLDKVERQIEIESKIRASSAWGFYSLPLRIPIPRRHR